MRFKIFFEVYCSSLGPIVTEGGISKFENVKTPQNALFEFPIKIAKIKQF